MISLEALTARLRKSGFRMTKVRLAILKHLMDEHCALSAQDILNLLKKQELNPNISTIYRELQFLNQQDIAQEVVLKDGVIRYEYKEGQHHHHLVCNSCESIQAFEMDKHLESVESSIQKKRNFRVMSHSLEFYGLCASCTV